MSAYDFEGEALWSKNLGAFNSQHGAGASPILYKDKLILANDMDKDDFTTKVPNARPSMLVALDKRTGRLVWETPRSRRARLLFRAVSCCTGPDRKSRSWSSPAPRR